MPAPDDPTEQQPPAEHQAHEHGPVLRPFAGQPNQERTVLFGDDVPDALANEPTQRPPITVTIHDSTGNSFTWPVSPNLPGMYVPGLGIFTVGFERVLPPVGSIIELAPEDDDHGPTRWHRLSEGHWVCEGNALEAEAYTADYMQGIIAVRGWAVVFDATR